MASELLGSADGSRRRVLIVDDNPQVRQELATLLPLAGDIEIIGTAADGLEGVQLAERLRPAVVLLDLQMPVMDGYETARQIKARSPSCRVIVLTVHGDPIARQQAMQAGVDLLFIKGTALETLVQAICEPGGIGT